MTTLTISGPISGGGRGWPFGVPVSIPANYRQDEYFVEGTANRYRPAAGAEMGPDGDWSAEQAGSAQFRTRIVVFRPVQEADFNGTVVITWNNVTAGYELFDMPESPEALSGYSVVALSAQRVGVHGVGEQRLGLRSWDPDRYFTLHIDSDDDSFDILTQVTRAVRTGREFFGVDPLGGLPVRRVIVHGHSQSANRLATYINAVHPLEGAVDGFLLQGYLGFGTPLAVGEAVVDVTDNSAGGTVLRATNRLRELSDAKVFVVHSELEATVALTMRQPDSDSFRCWEVAGTTHASMQTLLQRGPRLQRDLGTAGAGFLANADSSAITHGQAGYNALPLGPVVDAALHHLNAWIAEGTAPPRLPRLEFTGEPAQLARDEDGIAVGGARLPQVQAPTVTNSCVPLQDGLFAAVLGSSRPFPPEKVVDRYGTRRRYLERFAEAVEQAVASGLLLRRDGEEQVARCRELPFP